MRRRQTEKKRYVCVTLCIYLAGVFTGNLRLAWLCNGDVKKVFVFVEIPLSM